MKDHGLDLAIIGNGRTAALGRSLLADCLVVLSALRQRPDLLPIVGRQGGKGFLRRRARRLGGVSIRICAQYRDRLHLLIDRQGGKVKITDFVPRFRQFGRIFRPPQIFRIIEPMAGLPRITIRMRPTSDYGKPLVQRSLGSNHIRYSGEGTVIRLTTDAPLSLIDGEAPFVLTRPLHLVFGPDEPFPGDLQSTCRDFVDRTRDYWMEWVRRLSISYDWQEAIIRAAITLKLSNFDETGGDYRCAYHVDSGSARLRPHLGLSLLLAAGRLFRRPGAQPHRRDAHDGRIHLVYDLDRLETGPGAAAALQRRPDE